MKSGKNWQVVSQKTFKIYTVLYMYTAQGQGQIPAEDKTLIVTNGFYYFNHTV